MTKRGFKRKSDTQNLRTCFKNTEVSNNDDCLTLACIVNLSRFGRLKTDLPPFSLKFGNNLKDFILKIRKILGG